MRGGIVDRFDQAIKRNRLNPPGLYCSKEKLEESPLTLIHIHDSINSKGSNRKAVA